MSAAGVVAEPERRSDVPQPSARIPERHHPLALDGGQLRLATSTDSTPPAWSCAVCGRPLPGHHRGRPRSYCSDACKARAKLGRRVRRPRKPRQTHPCVVCGAPVVGQRKTCSEACRRKRRATSTAASRHICEMCWAQYRPTYTGQRTCSRECGRFLKWVNAGKPLSMPRLHGQHAHFVCYVEWRACPRCGRPFPADPSSSREFCSEPCARADAWRRVLAARPHRLCEECGAEFPDWNGRRFCAACAAKRQRTYRRESGMGNHRKRARHFNVPYEPINKRRVFERDHWRCHICGRKTTLRCGWWAPRRATLDHLVPLSRGGAHVYSNVACACFECNSLKSAGVPSRGDQLMLLG